MIKNFTYKGGEDSITLNVRADALPVKYNSDTICDWIDISIQYDKVDIKVKPTYDYKDRSADIVLENAKGSTIKFTVEQEGFSGIGIQCDKQIVLSHSYFGTSKLYSFYVTVYGGKTQELVCNEIQDRITKAWDNSDMYNDFIIKIPEGFSGHYTLYHSEYKNYLDYCKEQGIEFDEAKVKKDIDIVYISDTDIIGNIDIEYNDTTYSIYETIPVNVEYGTTQTLNILSTKYMRQKSMTQYEVIDNKVVDIYNVPSWLDISTKDFQIYIKANEKNYLGNRKIKMKVVNRSNSHQYLFIEIYQEK